VERVGNGDYGQRLEADFGQMTSWHIPALSFYWTCLVSCVFFRKADALMTIGRLEKPANPANDGIH
jgi:hypothetical protein